MNPPTYETCSHNPPGYYGDYRARYAIDWENSERKYKVPLDGVRVYENDTIVVNGNGYRNPRWRQRATHLGLDFVLPKGLKDVELYDPDTGRQVRKSELHKEIYLRHGNRLYYVKYDKPITFLHPDAQPVARSPVEYRVRNKPVEVVKREAIKEHIALGQTLNAVQARDRVIYYSPSYLGWEADQIAAGEAPLPVDLTTVAAQVFCKNIANAPARVNECIVNAAKDKFYPQYLIVKEKQ